jgi:drug/metabolite transporter (DMT)-like permease
MFESPAHALATMSATSWAIVAFLAVAPTTIAMLLWYSVLGRVEVGRLIYFVYLIPVVAIVTSWAMLGETLAPLQVLFAAMVISGVMTAQREPPGAEEGPPDGKETEKG